jgi:hypothetical protein
MQNLPQANPLSKKIQNIFFKKRPGSKPLFLSGPYQNSSLVSGSFRKISALPKFVDENEWFERKYTIFNTIGWLQIV